MPSEYPPTRFPAARRQAVREGERPKMIERRPARMRISSIEEGPDAAHRVGKTRIPLAIDEGRTRGRPLQTEKNPYGGGLSRAVRPQESGHAARLDSKTDVVEREPRAELLDETPDFDHATPTTWYVTADASRGA